MTEFSWRPLDRTDWQRLLRPELSDQYLWALGSFLQTEYSSFPDYVFPPCDKVFAALRLTSCEKTKVVIVGQDPYPSAGNANGLAFSVDDEVPKPPTLENVFCELARDVRLPIPSHGNLEAWARRGVLLLNATLTMRAEARPLHRRMWKPFTDAVIRVVAANSDPVFILWGKEAQRKKRAVLAPKPERFIESPHPSPLSARLGFFESKPFSRANKALRETQRSAIDWRLT